MWLMLYVYTELKYRLIQLKKHITYGFSPLCFSTDDDDMHHKSGMDARTIKSPSQYSTDFYSHYRRPANQWMMTGNPMSSSCFLRACISSSDGGVASRTGLLRPRRSHFVTPSAWYGSS